MELREKDGGEQPAEGRAVLLVTGDAALARQVHSVCAAAGVAVRESAAPDPAEWLRAVAVVVGADLARATAARGLPSRLHLFAVSGPDDVESLSGFSVEFQAAVVVLPQGSAALSGALADLIAPHGARGRVVAVLGTTGGVGTSTLATGLAETAARSGRSVALVDLDPDSGGIDLLLGAERSAGWRWPSLVGAQGVLGDLRAQLVRVDAIEVLAMARRGFPPTSDPTSSHPGPEAVKAVLESLRRSHELVVCDVGRTPGDAARAGLAVASHRIVLVAGTVRGLSAAREASRFWREGPGQPLVVLRRIRGGGLSRADLEAGLSTSVVTVLADEPGLVVAAERGDPPARSPRSPLARSCRALLAGPLAGPAAASSRTGLPAARPAAAQVIQLPSWEPAALGRRARPVPPATGEPRGTAPRRAAEPINPAQPTPAQLDVLRTRLVTLDRSPTPMDISSAMRVEGWVVSDRSVLDTVDLLQRDSVGAGPLDALLREPEVTDVLVNGPDDVFVDRGHGLVRAEVRFRDEEEVRRLAQRLAAGAGRRLDDAAPFVDARLADGTRVHAVLSGISGAGTCISLRVPARRSFSLDDCVAAGSLPAAGAEVLRRVVDRRLAFLVSGGTGSGKTTLLAALLGLVPIEERIVIVEDSRELSPDHPHVVRMEGRPANAEAAGAVTLADLVRQSLRMRPDRLVVGEVRGAEIADLLAALNTGHEGGCGTVHANSAADVPARLEALGALGGMSRAALHAQLGSAVHAVLQVTRDARGRRRVHGVYVVVRDEATGFVRVEPGVEFIDGELVWGPGGDRLRTWLG